MGLEYLWPEEGEKYMTDGERFEIQHLIGWWIVLDKKIVARLSYAGSAEYSPRYEITAYEGKSVPAEVFALLFGQTQPIDKICFMSPFDGEQVINTHFSGCFDGRYVHFRDYRVPHSLTLWEKWSALFKRKSPQLKLQRMAFPPQWKWDSNPML